MNFIHSCVWQLFLKNKRWDEMRKRWDFIKRFQEYFEINIVDFACRLSIRLCWYRTGTEITKEATLYNYPTVTFTLELQRKPLYYVVNLVAPCCLFSVIVVVGFVLQPGCSERLDIGEYLSDYPRSSVVSYFVCRSFSVLLRVRLRYFLTVVSL